MDTKEVPCNFPPIPDRRNVVLCFTGCKISTNDSVSTVWTWSSSVIFTMIMWPASLYCKGCMAPNADLLEHPEAHCFPCTWPRPIHVHRRLPLDQPASWEEYTFHLAPMNGHTRFASLIGFVADGLRFTHTGDQYMPLIDKQGDYDRLDRHNYVFRNGALLDGYKQSAEWLRQWRPDILISSHWNTTRTNEKFFQQIDAYRDKYEQMHQRVMPLADDQIHFNLDSWGGWIWPYRIVLEKPGNSQPTQPLST